MGDDKEKLLKAKVIHEFDKNCIINALGMYTKNETLMKNCSK